MSALGGVLTGAVFTGIVLLLQRRAGPNPTGSEGRAGVNGSDAEPGGTPDEAAAREVSFAWLASTLVSGVVATFMLSQLAGENECSVRTSLLPAASLGLMALILGFLVSLQWLLFDLDVKEPRFLLFCLYLMSAVGVSTYVAVSASNFVAWPNYASADGLVLVAHFAFVLSGMAAAVLLRSGSHWRPVFHRRADYLSLVLLLVTGIGLVAFVVVQGRDMSAIRLHHGDRTALLYLFVSLVLVLGSTLALPPYSDEGDAEPSSGWKGELVSEPAVARALSEQIELAGIVINPDGTWRSTRPISIAPTDPDAPQPRRFRVRSRSRSGRTPSDR